MITCEHGFFRAAEPDDAPVLRRIFDARAPRAAIIDGRREIQMPNTEELREMLAQRDTQQNAFYAVEDKRGDVRGFCALRGVKFEAGFAELSVMFLDDATLEEPLAREALDFALDRGFQYLGLRKLVAHALTRETALRAFLVANGFSSDGVQRDAYYGQGQWQGLESLTRFAPGRET